MTLTADIRAYHSAQTAANRKMLARLGEVVSEALPKAESRIWHGGPVWFLDGNPIVGYHVIKGGVRILFWSGRSFKESGLAPEGSFQAAEMRYADAADIKMTPLRGWLRQAKRIQWDYKNIVKRKGKLVKIGTW